MTTTIQLVCWVIAEFIIVFTHVIILVNQFGDDIYKKNSPQELIDKIINIVLSCSFFSVLVGICFLKLSTL